MVLASNEGSNSLAITVMACTSPSTLVPITLIGNRQGYLIKDSDSGLPWGAEGVCMGQLSQSAVFWLFLMVMGLLECGFLRIIVGFADVPLFSSALVTLL